MLNRTIMSGSFRDDTRHGLCSMIYDNATASVASIGGVGGIGYWSWQFQYDFNSFYLAV